MIELLDVRLGFMGVSDPQAIQRIVHRYGVHIAGYQAAILGLYALVGSVLGGVGERLLRNWDWARFRATSRLRAIAASISFTVLGHLCFLGRHVIRYPQLYAEWFYEPGGVRRKLMTLLTDRVSLTFWGHLPVLLLLFFAGGPLLYPRSRGMLGEGLGQLRGSWRGKHAKTAAGAVALASLLFGAMLVARSPQPASTERPNLILIAVDSLRADRVFADGTEPRFPSIANVSSRGVRFRQAFVTIARTFPSFVTLLTGRYPYHHGIRHMFPTRAAREAIGLALPQVLRDAGYQTAVLSDYAGEIFSRTPLGFGIVDVPHFDMRSIVDQRGLEIHPNVLPYATGTLGRRLFPSVKVMPELSDPSLLADRAIETIDHLADKPFFLTIFFSTPHFPYAAPDPYYRRYTNPAYEGPFRYSKPALSTAGSGDVKQIAALYDGAVASVDDAIKRILAELDRTQLSHKTILVLLSDHGENLYDNPRVGMGHGDHLLGEVANHIPLVVLDPVHGWKSHDVEGVVRDVDIAPTLAKLLGIEPAPSDGVDLEPLLAGERNTLDLHSYSETEFWFTANGPGFSESERLPYPGITGATDLDGDDDIFLKSEWEAMVVAAKHRSVRTTDWQLIYEPTRKGPRWLLFDRHDPTLEDVGAKHVNVVSNLRAELERWMTADGKTEWRAGFAVPK